MMSRLCLMASQGRDLKRKVITTVYFVLLALLLIYSLLPVRFAESDYSHIQQGDIVKELVSSPLSIKYARKHNKTLCSLVPNLFDDTLMYANESTNILSSVDLASDLGIASGGVWKPKGCVSQHQVALIVPYRNRASQLDIFLGYIHPFLQKQMLSYRVIIVEQSYKKPFNRAKLFNIGFVETLKIWPYHCSIFHDVDLIPQKSSNIYGCTHHPRHMSSSLNTFRYNLPYRGLFGGAISIQNTQFQLVNGFSNVFYGWGGEDDDFQRRIVNKGMNVCRFAPEVARYTMLAHAKELPSENRYDNLKTGGERFESDGLNTLNYTLDKIENLPLYTRIFVNVL